MWPKVEREVVPTRLATLFEESMSDPGILRLLEPIATVAHARVVELTGPDRERLAAYLDDVRGMLPDKNLRGDAFRLARRLREKPGVPKT